MPVRELLSVNIYKMPDFDRINGERDAWNIPQSYTTLTEIGPCTIILVERHSSKKSRSMPMDIKSTGETSLAMRASIEYLIGAESNQWKEKPESVEGYSGRFEKGF